MEMEVSNNENTVEDFNNIVCISGNECRICLKKCLNACQLFENDKEIPRKLTSFAAVQVVEGDGLPTIICLSCYQLLEMSYKFKCQIQKSDIKLREILCRKPHLHSDNKDSTSVKSFIVDIISNVCEQKASQYPEQSINICGDILSNDCTNTIDTASVDKSHQQQLEGYSHVMSPIPENNNIFNNVQTTGQYKEKELGIEEKDSEKAEQDLYNTSISIKEEDIISDREMKLEVHSDANHFSNRTLENTHTDDQVEKNSSESIDSNKEKTLTGQIHHEKNSCSTEFYTTKLSPSIPEAVSEKCIKTKLCYVCYICDKQFSSVVKLKSHIVDNHNFLETDKTTIKKNVQDKRTRKSSLREEQEVKSCDNKLNSSKIERKNQEFACKVCLKRFAYRKSFLSHTKTHPEYKSKPLNNDFLKNFDTMHNVQTNVNISKESKYRDDDDQKDEDDDDDDGDEEDDGDLPTKSLQCTQCGKLFATKRNLKRHISTHSGIKYECLTCGKEFSRLDKLKDHEQSKHKEEMFGQSEEEENEYDEDASYENKLQYGIENRKKDKQHNRPHKCSLCPKAFAHPQSLANHIERHKRVKDTQKRFLCEVCSKCFAQSGSLVAHMRTHTGVKPYVCNVCSRAFTKSTYLQLHLRTHSGEKPYICQYCSRAFARANTLARHITMHTGEAKYHCQICTKSFRRLTSLNEHTYTHTGQRPYACKICTKRYNNAGSLYAHTKKCKAQRLSGTSALPGSIDTSVEHSGSPMSQVLIYSQKKFVENTTVNQITPTSQYMIANVHNQKTLPSNVIQQFTPDDQNLYTINTKQLKNPYYAIYPNM